MTSIALSSHRRASYSPEVLERYERLFADTSKPLSELVRIEDPAFYVNPWPIYARLQSEAPAYYYEEMNSWVVTRLSDVQYVARTPSLFSVERGKLLYDAVRSGQSFHDVAGGGDVIGLTDPPRHHELRRVMAPPFTPPALARLRDRIDLYIDELLTAIEPGVPFDWVQFAARLPILVICALLGLPDADQDHMDAILRWSDSLEAMSGQNLTPEQHKAQLATFTSLTDFMSDVISEKRSKPGDDFISSLLHDHLDGRNLSEETIVGHLQILISSSTHTTRGLLAEMVSNLGTASDQQRRLWEQPELIANAVEEVLRYSAPAHGLSREVVGEAKIAGEDIHPGQWVHMSFEAANRDRTQFPDPGLFDVGREESRKHVAFGYATHVCLAAPLVRLEAALVLRRLMDRFSGFELAGPGVRVESFLRNSWVELPVVFLDR